MVDLALGFLSSGAGDATWPTRSLPLLPRDLYHGCYDAALDVLVGWVIFKFSFADATLDAETLGVASGAFALGGALAAGDGTPQAPSEGRGRCLRKTRSVPLSGAGVKTTSSKASRMKWSPRPPGRTSWSSRPLSFDGSQVVP